MDASFLMWSKGNWLVVQVSEEGMGGLTTVSIAPLLRQRRSRDPETATQARKC